jgi:4-carboxymuconolactone decarboxylase
MTVSNNRIPPLTDDEISEEQREVLGLQLMRGKVPNVFRTIARHPKLFKPWLAFGMQLLSENTLSDRDREIAILRAGFLSDSEYEWAQHVIIGKRVGITDEELEGVKQGSAASCWNDLERLIIRAADELHEAVVISDETWTGLTANYSTEQILDLIFTCGQYRMLAGVLNSLGVPLDDDIKG